jgi:hypothetical protein
MVPPLMDDAGRAGDPFELRSNMLRARTAADFGDAAHRWADVGGTHVAVSTMGLGYTTVEQHLDYASQALEAARGS